MKAETLIFRNRTIAEIGLTQVTGFARRRLGLKELLPKFLPFLYSENVPFEPVKTQTICWFSGRILSPKPLFALAVMTQGEEFEQCLCNIDPFPLSESHLQTDKTSQKSGLFLRLWLHIRKCSTDILYTNVSCQGTQLHAYTQTYSQANYSFNYS